MLQPCNQNSAVGRGKIPEPGIGEVEGVPFLQFVELLDQWHCGLYVHHLGVVQVCDVVHFSEEIHMPSVILTGAASRLQKS